MPYLKRSRRRQLARREVAISTAGDLNYVFTSAIRAYLRERGLSYATCNDVVGALTCCKDEFYRRVVAPYEDQKVKENGDVYI